MSSVRLLHVVSTLNPAAGGIVSALRALNRALEEAGHGVHTVCLDEPDDPWLAGRGESVTALGAGRSSWQYHAGLKSFLLDRAASTDAWIVHGLWQYLGFATRSASRLAGTPYFVFPHGMLDPWFNRTYPKKHLKKWLYWPWGEYLVLRDAAAVLFTCEEEKLRARESFPQLYRVRERVAGLGLRAENRNATALAERFRNSRAELKDKRILLFLGRLHPKKGLDLLIRAFGEVCSQALDWRLVIGGSVSGTDVGPDDLAILRDLADRLCPPHSVIFCGLLEGEDKWGALCAADAFVLPSHQENFGMAVVEALSCSVPVLISDKVNLWREIEQDGAGLVEPDTIEGTRRLLERWTGLDEPTRLRMRDRARMSFENRFDARRAADALVAAVMDGTNTYDGNAADRGGVPAGT